MYNNVNMAVYKFILPSKQRKVIWVHEDVYRDLKKYSWAMGMSIAEATHGLLLKALEDAKNGKSINEQTY